MVRLALLLMLVLASVNADAARATAHIGATVISPRAVATLTASGCDSPDARITTRTVNGVQLVQVDFE